jgi:hypothetical protein
MVKFKEKRHPIDVVDKPKERADKLRADFLTDDKHARNLAKSLEVLDHPPQPGRGLSIVSRMRNAHSKPGRYDAAMPKSTGAFVTSLDILEIAGLPKPGLKGVAKVVKNPDGTLVLVEKEGARTSREMKRNFAALHLNARMQKACIVTDEDKAPKKS